jgi:hypothetical protein
VLLGLDDSLVVIAEIRVLEADARDPRIHQRLHRAVDAAGGLDVAALEVGAHGDVDTRRHPREPADHLVPRRLLSVGEAQAPGEGGAARGDGREAGGLEHAGAAHVPGVRDDEEVVAAVQRLQQLSLVS